MYINYSQIPVHFNIASFILHILYSLFWFGWIFTKFDKRLGFSPEDSAVLGCFVFTNIHDFFTTSKKEILRYVLGLVIAVLEVGPYSQIHRLF